MILLNFHSLLSDICKVGYMVEVLVPFWEVGKVVLGECLIDGETFFFLMGPMDQDFD